MIKLYTTDHCPRCRQAEALLDGVGHYKLDVILNSDELKRDCLDNELDINLIREAPVMVTENGLFTGEDVIIELDEMLLVMGKLQRSESD